MPIETSLSANLLLARNLAILTPFQKTTRDRITLTLPSLAAKIRADRLQLAKIGLWVSVLESDLERERREYSRVRHVALQAAAKSLRDPLGVKGVVEAVNQDSSEGESVPIPILSLPEQRPEEDAGYKFGTSPGELPVIIRRQSDEFGRPTGFRTSGPNPPQIGQRPKLGRQVSDSSTEIRRPVFQRSSSDYLKAVDGENGQSGDSRNSTPPMMFTLSDVEEKEEERKRKSWDEEPEDWQNTRAARRVSLANIPGDVAGKLKMSSGPGQG
jgi:hypothetical protein